MGVYHLLKKCLALFLVFKSIYIYVHTLTYIHILFFALVQKKIYPLLEICFFLQGIQAKEG